MDKLILASKSVVRKKILHDNNIQCEVIPSKLDEGPVKEKLIMSKANPNKIAKNLASLKAKKVSEQFINRLVLGADSVIDLNGELISKPKDREEALNILKLNGKLII